VEVPPWGAALHGDSANPRPLLSSRSAPAEHHELTTAATSSCSASPRRRPAAEPSPPSDSSSGHPPPALAALQASPRHSEHPRHTLLACAWPNRPGGVAQPLTAALFAAGEAPVTLGSRAAAVR